MQVAFRGAGFAPRLGGQVTTSSFVPRLASQSSVYHFFRVFIFFFFFFFLFLSFPK